MKGISVILACVLMNVTAQVMLKHAMRGKAAHFGDGAPAPVDIILGGVKLLFNPFVFGALSLYALGAIFWLFVLSRFDLSYAYPFGALSYVLITAASWLIFKEDIPALRLVGIGCIMVGILILARS